MRRSPRCRNAASPTRARSIIRKFSRRSTASATQALSVANIARAAVPRTDLPGRGLMVWFRAAEVSNALLQAYALMYLGFWDVRPVQGQGHVGTKKQSCGERKRSAVAAQG